MSVIRIPGQTRLLKDDPALQDRMWDLHINHGLSATSLRKRFGGDLTTISRIISSRRVENGLPTLRKTGHSEFGSNLINSNRSLKGENWNRKVGNGSKAEGIAA